MLRKLPFTDHKHMFLIRRICANHNDRVLLFISVFLQIFLCNRSLFTSIQYPFCFFCIKKTTAIRQTLILKDARAAKGAELTDKESEAVRKIAKLTYSMNSRRENDPGDLSIKTNSLTARGGFQGGAVAPDLERYNRITAENSRQTLARMRTLETNVAKILRIFEG